MRTIGKIISVGIFVLGLSALAQTASAASCTAGATLFDGVSGADLTTSTACANAAGGGPLGNDTVANIAALDPFAITDWVLADKSDGPEGDHAIVLSDVVNGANSGSWSVSSFNGYTSVFLTIKSSNDYAAYLLDTNFLSGLWTTAQIFPSGGGGKNISHMSLFYSPSSLTVVPLPAALPLYGAGILVLGFLGWRKRSGSKTV